MALHDPSPVSAIRANRILTRTPSEASIARQLDRGAPDRATAIMWANTRLLETAERHARGEHYGAAPYGRRDLIILTRDLDPAAWDHARLKFGEDL